MLRDEGNHVQTIRSVNLIFSLLLIWNTKTNLLGDIYESASNA